MINASLRAISAYFKTLSHLWSSRGPHKMQWQATSGPQPFSLTRELNCVFFQWTITVNINTSMSNFSYLIQWRWIFYQIIIFKCYFWWKLTTNKFFLGVRILFWSFMNIIFSVLICIKWTLNEFLRSVNFYNTVYYIVTKPPRKWIHTI